MSCQLCASTKQKEFTTEINIHSRGLENIDDPGVLFFPNVVVCLDCGWSYFSTPHGELLRLAGCAAACDASHREGSNGTLRDRIRLEA
jgi:hypothetical protein